MSKSFESSRAAEPVGAFPHARRVGDLLFLSGIGPRVRGSKEIPGVTLDAERNIVSYDIERQCHAVFENVRLAWKTQGRLGTISSMFRLFNQYEEGLRDL